MNSSPPMPLSFKPDLADAAGRWDAFYAGEILDRPPVLVTAPRSGFPPAPPVTYRDKVFGDLDEVIARAIAAAESTFWGGEAVPCFKPTFGPDEVAAFAGGELRWSDDSPNTNWAAPFVEDWEQSLPLRLQTDQPLWRRMLEVYRRSAEKMAGKMLICPPDLHTNMDLLAAIRGPQRLCLDLMDQPQIIARAMQDARALFPQIWEAVSRAGQMPQRGYCQHVYSMEGAAMLQCDFICMIRPEMFRRFVLPALEEEAQIVKHVFFHWDGPGALAHTQDVLASRGLNLLAYIPGAGRGSHIQYLDLLKRLQAGGKAVHARGTPGELQRMHRELKPEKVVYSTEVSSPAEAELLLEWFVRNT